jgi:putative endonuclease
MRNFYVYIMTNRNFGVLYIGVTNNIVRRVYEHRHKVYPGFTSRYNLKRLVYYEHFEGPGSAIAREKQLKGWLRSEKIALIVALNPEWNDLSAGWYEEDARSDQK